MTVRDITGAAAPENEELLRRIDGLVKLGTRGGKQSRPGHYLLVGYFRRYTAEPIRVVVGAPGLANLLGEQFYSALPGALLEGLGKLLADNVKIYVFPVLSAEITRRDARRGGLPAE